MRAREIGRHLRDGAFLGGGELKRQVGEEELHETLVARSPDL